MSKTYIHFGKNAFNKSLCEENIKQIRNRYEEFHPYLNKPTNCFWASDVKSLYGWKHFCMHTNYNHYDIPFNKNISEQNYFKFKLSNKANILELKTIEDFENFKNISDNKIYLKNPFDNENLITFDYVKLLKDYDGLEINADSNFELKSLFGGWDCDSIVISNSNIIKPIY